MKKRKNYSMIFLTLLSAFLFTLFITASSLSPLAQLGKNANQFGSIGMWAAIGMVLILYFIPLLVYVLGVDAMKYVMAVLSGFGLIIAIAAFFIILFIGFIIFRAIQPFAVVVTVCVLLFLVNIFWFFAAFRTSKPVS